MDNFNTNHYKAASKYQEVLCPYLHFRQCQLDTYNVLNKLDHLFQDITVLSPYLQNQLHHFCVHQSIDRLPIDVGY